MTASLHEYVIAVLATAISTSVCERWRKERKKEKEKNRGKIAGRKERKEKKRKGNLHTEILHPHRCARPILTNLIIPIREDARRQPIIKHRIMVILLIAPVPIATAMTKIIFKRNIRRRGNILCLIRGAEAGGGDVGLGPVAELVVDALGLAGVDVGVVPEGEGGIGRDGVVGVVVVADGGEAFVVVFAGAVVEGEDLRGWVPVSEVLSSLFDRFGLV